MVVVVGPDGVRLDEPDDLKGFKVVVEAGTEDEAPDALAEVGRLADRDTAWIRADAVRSLAEGRVAEGWDAGFTAMLEYAAGKGWIREGGPDGTEIQAHVEWPG